MPRASTIRSTFNAGELSPLMDGRVDVAKYNNGARIVENFIPSVQGPAVRRPGFRYVAEVKNSSQKTWLAKFEFNNTQAFNIEFGDYYVRFYTNHGQLLTPSVSSVSLYSGATAYGVGDLVKDISGNIYYCRAAVTGTGPPNATYWYALTISTYTGVNAIYEIPTPYASADLTETDGTFKLSMVQSGDIIYIAHPSYPLQALSRYSNTKWTMAAASLINGPFKTQNTDKTILVSATGSTGSVTLTASSGIFQAGHVGSYFYLEPADLSAVKPWTAGQEFSTAASAGTIYRRSDGKTYLCQTAISPTSGKVWRTGPDKPIHTYGTEADGDGQAISGTTCEHQGLSWQFIDAGYGYVKITGFTDSTHVTAVVQGDWGLPTGCVTTSTFRWAFGAFSGVEGYPSKVSFFRERLTLAKGIQLYFSCAGDFLNFAAKDSSGNIVADRAIQVTISSNQVNTVQWLAPSQALIIGTSGSEFACMENTTSEAFAPGNVKIEQQTTDGCKSVAPATVGYSILMVQASGRKLKEIAYNFQQNGYVTSDLSVLSEHITVGGIVQMTWHKEPYVALWAARGDGTLLGFTFNKEQDVVGWHRHPVGGGGIVESVCTMPAPSGDRDELWTITKRTINGVTKRYIEYMEDGYKTGGAQEDCFYVDCGLTYYGAATTTINGLFYLEGKTVQVLTNGASHPDRVVTGGTISLQIASTKVQVGLGYTSTLQTNRVEGGAADGTSQGKMKRINKVVLRFYNTLGAKAGPSTATLDEIPFRSGSDPMDKPPPLFTGDKLIEWPNGYDFDGYVTVQQYQPLPMTLVAIMPQTTVFDR